MDSNANSIILDLILEVKSLKNELDSLKREVEKLKKQKPTTVYPEKIGGWRLCPFCSKTLMDNQQCICETQKNPWKHPAWPTLPPRITCSGIAPY